MTTSWSRRCSTTRRALKLEQAWSDLLASFEYHDARIRFVADKYKVDLKKKSIAELNEADVEAMPEEPRNYIRPLLAEYKATVATQRAARAGHVEDCPEVRRQGVAPSADRGREEAAASLLCNAAAGSRSSTIQSDSSLC